MKCEIEVSRKIDDLIPLLEEAARWLWVRGIRQWQPGSIASELEDVSDDVSRFAVLARHAGVPAGGCILSSARPPVWQNFEGAAAYLSWLVVGRAYAGCGLAETVVAEAERWAARNQLSRLRLDCWSGNAKLRGLYRRLGFSEMEIAAENEYTVALFEKTVVSS